MSNGEPAAQTISPSVLTSMSGTSRFLRPFRSHLPTPSLSRKVLEMRLFSVYRLGKYRIINYENKGAAGKPYKCKSFQPRRFAGQVCLQNNQRQKQQKQKRVKSRKVLLTVKAAAKLCCRRRSLYSTKTRNQGRVVFPSEISTLPLTPHFCSETLSIMIINNVAHAKRRGLKTLLFVKPSGRALLFLS